MNFLQFLSSLNAFSISRSRSHFHITCFIPSLGSPPSSSKAYLQTLPSTITSIFLPPTNLEQKTDPSVLALQIELSVNLSLPYIRQELKSLCSRAKVVAFVVDVFANGALDLPDGIFMNTFLGLESEAITTLHEHMKGKPVIYPVGPIRSTD
ncbi:hypothetical protein VIGAN_09028600 [Vigna angularis var. angularis]|uniref:Uncharacterized protein n=1 Tax=Vigna angularis var. angularis TaxID=157739 RepID=A0A0S3SVN4_PHAAN|nr:hypothetical protein VIGAN_09028600 [Vigna angularis var. angularis]